MSAVIRPLGEPLSELPAGPDLPGATAGPSFELYGTISAPVNPARAWLLFAERLADQAEVCDALSREVGAPPRLAYLTTNLRLAAATIKRGATLDGTQPWPFRAWLGAWDGDALCGFTSGRLEIPTR